MPRIAQHSIEAIKQQVNLVDVVAPYVQLKQAGRSWKGLSPFNSEKTPSFYVHPDRGFYKCFSSGEGGDLFTFIMKMENLGFSEAIEHIARKFNITLEYEEGGPSREQASLRKQLFELHELAADWFHEQFRASDEAGPVRNYWEEDRGFDMEIAETVKIGYAPVETSAFARFCAERSITAAAMQESGLFYVRQGETNPQRFRSRFRGRLMIPIRDVQGRVVAFTARQLQQTPQDDPAREAKYINSPGTPIFEKSNILFGMDHARTHLKPGDNFLLVEGQLDAIRCWSVGLHNTVAPQGTAITDKHMHLLRRYQPGAVECLLDGDAAGRKAALGILPQAFKAGLECRFLLLPESADPDQLLREQGAEGIAPLREKAVGPIELAVAENLPSDRAPSTREKTAALETIFELLQNVSSEVAREDYLERAARLIKVDPAAALRDFHRAGRRRYRRGTSESNDNGNEPAKSDNKLLTQATWELLWLVLHFPEHGQPISEVIDYEWIDTNSVEGKLLARLLNEHQEGLIDDATSVESILESIEERGLLAEIHSRDLQVEEPKEQIAACLKKLYRNHLNERKKQLEQKIADADPSSNPPLELMRRVKTIRKELARPLHIEL